MFAFGFGDAARTMNDRASIQLRLRPCLFLLLIVSASCRDPGPERIQPNDNREPAGRLRNGVLTLQLVAREGDWYPDGPDSPSLHVFTFAERGRPAQNPGPLIRVPTGTTLRVSLHSELRDSVLVVYGLHTRPGTANDSIHVEPGGIRDLSFTAGEPGTYFYWGTTTNTAVAD